MDTITLNIRGGARIRVPHDLDQITPYVLLEQEDWFEDEIRFVRRYLVPGMHALDIGANFGVYTLAMAAAVGECGTVRAFEPTPDTAALLRASIEDNGARQVQVHEAAVSDRAGSARLSLHAASELNALGQGGDGVEVRTLALDDLARDERWLPLDFVKIDAEGHEPQVIDGAQRLLREHSPLVMIEIKAGDRIDFSAAQRLAALGYQAYLLVPGPMLLAPFDPGKPADPFLLNLFCCKPDRAAALAARGLLAPGPAPSEVSARATQEAWRAFLQETAYAPALSASWPAKPGLLAGEDAKAYLEALYLFAWSRRGEVDSAQRLGLLQGALARVAKARAARDTLPRLMSYARLALQLGRRGDALAALRAATERIDSQAEAILREPFLPPLPRYEQVRPTGSGQEWLLCAVAEALEKVGAFSSMFTGTSTLPVLESIAGSSLRSPETERRRQLMRMRARLQAGPQPHALLASEGEENLNRQYWCAQS